MADLKGFIAERGRLKTRLTLFKKYLDPLLDTKLNKADFNELTLRLSKIQDLNFSFEELQSKIESLDENEDEQLIEREEFENKYFKLVAQAQELLQNSEIKLHTSSESGSTSSSVHRHSNLKLPPLKIPSFNGESNKWLEFRDMYISLVHNTDSLDDVSKFHYLKSYLEGSAKSVIDSVTVTSDNYSIARSLLCDRYDNRRLLINEHIKCLFSLENMPRESEKDLRTLIDSISKNLSALNSLGEPTHHWDSLIIYMASTKLDPKTARDWEQTRCTLDSTKLSDFFDFLRQRATVLETVHAGKSEKSEKRHSLIKSKSFTVSSSSNTNSQTTGNCLNCKQNHKLYDCHKFKSLPIDERIAKISEWQICANCLRFGHRSFQCRLGGCRICRKKHNTIIHKQSSLNDNTSTPQTSQQNPENTSTSFLNTSSGTSMNVEMPSSVASQPAGDASCVVSMSAVAMGQSLLSTALIKVTNNGKSFTLRALLDPCSQSSFITEEAAAKIGINKTKNPPRSVFGLNNAVISITEHCDVVIKSSYTSFSTPVQCFIVPLITDEVPQMQIRVNDLDIPQNIQLADPNFFMPSQVDVLLGVDVVWDMISLNKIKLGPNKPYLIETKLGWIVAGPLGWEYYVTSSNRTFCHFSKNIQQQLSKFFELEEIPPEKTPSFDEHYCEKLFNETTYRDKDGRFSVQIPLRESPEVLGDSYHQAEKRMFQLEKRMNRNPKLAHDYTKFMQEYQDLGHMSEVTNPTHGCFLPHHPVIKESSETTKTRGVFDAAAETSTGKSLNDIQYVGPVVQDDLFSILLRFRQHQYVVSADVEKMYRQVLVQPQHRPLQMILWRDSVDLPIKIFQLNTVTYGTASAPFLATRCLLQLSKECTDEKIAQLIKSDFYVDDFLSGSNSKSELSRIISSVTEILHSACFPLRKFRTNVPSIFENNPSTLIPKDLDFTSQSSALGLKWDPAADVLIFPTDFQSPSVATKRTILSNSAKLFDPLGLLSICTIIPKIILQQLWLTKLDWDEPIPSDIERMWFNFVSGLNNLSSLQIPRCVLSEEPDEIELHAFCDASQNAFAACIYLRSLDKSGKVDVNLICAKTKVAPVKPQTIPRLELCGALLAARLASKVIKALRLDISKQLYWTDSSVVLGWLSSQARDLKTFVANRVAEIQQLTSSGTWRHVPGVDNPADLASRGLDPKLIHKALIWWQGPSFLLKNESDWPSNVKPISELPEMKTNSTNQIDQSNPNIIACATTTAKETYLSNTVNFQNHSKFTIMLRSTAYVLRFIHNLKHKDSKRTGFLTADELESSLNHLIKEHQAECFEHEMNLLKNKKCLPSRSRLLSLRPFIGEDGYLRLGGRIQKASEAYSRKHPILLDSNHAFTKLLLAHEHKRLLHCGPQLLLSNVRQSYWPISGRRLARSIINNCRLCRIMKAKTVSPIMGNLPISRVTPNYPFQICGCDMAGPFPIRDRLGRGCKIIKAYLCLFVCFSTRALHLELASDLSTDAFILCLRRLISRRGKPNEIYCDNGRNFVGANNDLSNFINSSNESISSFAADEGIKFKFSPAYSPHFGGLWEAGVKSAKHHLYRTLGSTHLTYEELSTLFVQIESILNSRPLTPLSSDPTDLLPLTPGHFLIGRPLTSLPSPRLTDVKMTGLDRFQQIEQMRQHFWERWRNEFLSELQQRSKWRVSKGELHQGEMVILKEPNLPPLKWRMGRIHHLYPGADGIARVADVMTSKGIVRRAVSNLCPLPSEKPEEEASSRNPTVFEGGETVGA